MNSQNSSRPDGNRGSAGLRRKPGGDERTSRKPHVQNRWLNPMVIALLKAGFGPPTYALVETVGRRSGRRRIVPVGNGLDGDIFWFIAGLGEAADPVRNIQQHPRVRVCAAPPRIRDGLRMRWRSGTAHPMPDDDPDARHRLLARGRPVYRADGAVLRNLAAGGRMLTVRIDLD